MDLMPIISLGVKKAVRNAPSNCSLQTIYRAQITVKFIHKGRQKGEKYIPGNMV